MTEIMTMGKVTAAYISGDLDHHSAAQIRSEIDREIADKHPKRLIIDFAGVTFMDSSGIGLIMGRYKLMSAFGGDVIVSRPPAYIKKVLKLAGIDRLAPVYDKADGILPREYHKEKEVTPIEQTTTQSN